MRELDLAHIQRYAILYLHIASQSITSTYHITFRALLGEQRCVRVRRGHSVADICDRNAAGACRSPRSVGTTARSATADNQHRRSPASHGDARSSGPTRQQLRQLCPL